MNRRRKYLPTKRVFTDETSIYRQCEYEPMMREWTDDASIYRRCEYLLTMRVFTDNAWIYQQLEYIPTVRVWTYNASFTKEMSIYWQKRVFTNNTSVNRREYLPTIRVFTESASMNRRLEYLQTTRVYTDDTSHHKCIITYQMNAKICIKTMKSTRNMDLLNLSFPVKTILMSRHHCIITNWWVAASPNCLLFIKKSKTRKILTTRTHPCTLNSPTTLGFPRIVPG